MSKKRTTKSCPAVAIIREFRATAAAGDAATKAAQEAHEMGLTGSAAYDYVEALGMTAGDCAFEPWLATFDKINALAKTKGAAISKDGAIEAMKLITEGLPGGYRMDVETCEALAAIALRHLEPPNATA